MSLTPQGPPDADLVDRKYLSQFATQQVGFEIQTSAGPVDADNLAVTAALVSDRDGTVVFTRPADRLGVGVYGTTLAAEETAVPGPYRMVFTYLLGGVADRYEVSFEVGSSAPDYDALPLEMKMVVEQVWIRFADGYDSPLGGPHLQTYLQTKFGRNRMAQLLRQSVQRLNIISQPAQNYAVDQPFPHAQWGALLVQALYVETLKHLIRSYVEIPDVVLGTTVSRHDRRDYMERWRSVLEEETADLVNMLDHFKIAHMGLGNVSVLVSGGAYGNFGPWATPGSAGEGAARGYFFGRARMF